jgi:hypothetical protein
MVLDPALYLVVFKTAWFYIPHRSKTTTLDQQSFSISWDRRNKLFEGYEKNWGGGGKGREGGGSSGENSGVDAKTTKERINCRESGPN